MGMNSVIVGAVSAVLLAGAGFYFGYARSSAPCVKCQEINTVSSVSSWFESAQKVIIVEEGRSLRSDFSLEASTWAGLAKFLSKIGFNDASTGVISFDANFAYGYDLKDAKLWTIAAGEAGGLVFNAPPIKLLTCPSVITQTLSISFSKKSIFVNEDARLLGLVRVATAIALSEAHKRLNNESERALIIKTADEQLAILLSNLAKGIGKSINPQQIKILRPNGDFLAPANWAPLGDSKNLLDNRTKKMLSDAGCKGV